MSKMNQAVKAKWVAALRSGEYKQGKMVLNDGEGSYCCLGVLCDLYAKKTGTGWVSEQRCDGKTAMRLEVSGHIYYPAEIVRLWARFHEDEKPVEIDGYIESVAVHNDGRVGRARTFAEIADAIEAQL